MITKKKKRTCKIVDFAVPADNRVKLKESEKKNKYLDFTRELKKLWNMKVNYNWCSWYSYHRYNKGIGELGNKRMSGDHLNNCITLIGQNTEKNPGDLRRLGVTQTRVNDHQRSLM